MKISSVKIGFKLEDLWVGIYWDTTMRQTDTGTEPFATDLYICVVPCFPLHIVVWHSPTINY